MPFYEALSCLVVLHRPPLILETGKKVFTVQKYTAPNFQNSKKVFFFFENFDLLKNIFKVVVVNLFTFQNWFKTCMKRFFGKVDLFAPSLGDKEAIIHHVTSTLIWKKNLKKKKKNSARPHLLQKSCGGQPNNFSLHHKPASPLAFTWRQKQFEIIQFTHQIFDKNLRTS